MPACAAPVFLGHMRRPGNARRARPSQRTPRQALVARATTPGCETGVAPRQTRRLKRNPRRAPRQTR
eukprot:11218719-Lingulodinium_polyedra.AAC.1